MKKLFIFILPLLLMSCSAQKQLARLLVHHPELKTGESVRTVVVDVPVPAVSIDMTFPAQADTVSRTDTVTIFLDKPTFDKLKTGISVTEGNVTATVRLLDGEIDLHIEQIPDTIHHQEDFVIPTYEAEVIVKKELTKWQQFFFTGGVIFMVLLVLGCVISVAIIVVKMFR